MATEESFVAETLKVVIPAILGFYFGKKQASNLANRSECWELLNNLKSDLSVATQDALEYYSNNRPNNVDGINIQRKAQKIGSDFYSFLSGLELPKQTGLVLNYRKALTFQIDKINTLSDVEKGHIKAEIIEAEIKVSEFAWEKFREKYRN